MSIWKAHNLRRIASQHTRHESPQKQGVRRFLTGESDFRLPSRRATAVAAVRAAMALSRLLKPRGARSSGVQCGWAPETSVEHVEKLLDPLPFTRWELVYRVESLLDKRLHSPRRWMFRQVLLECV